MPAPLAKVMVRGLAAVDRRSQGARQLVAWRQALGDHCGGEAALTAVQRARIATASQTRLLLDHIDAYLVQHETLFGRKGTLRGGMLKLIDTRNRMADNLDRTLAALGQQGKTGPAPPPIADLLAGS
jgi:hypothetical protein